MQQFLSPVIPFLRIGFNLEARQRMMTAHNAARSYNMRNAQASNGEIDYAKVCLTYGNLPAATEVHVEIDDLGAHFSWTNQCVGNYLRGTDQVMLMLYELEKGLVFSETGGAKRAKQLESIPLPLAAKGMTFHCWISFIAEDRQAIATSTYCGSFVF